MLKNKYIKGVIMSQLKNLKALKRNKNNEIFQVY